MAFWALDTLNKFKGISIKDATSKLKGYYNVTPDATQTKPKEPLFEEAPVKQKPKKINTEEQLMELQLRQYKKLVQLQEKVVRNYEQSQREKLQTRQKKLQELNRQLLQQEEEQRKNRQKNELISELEAGKKSIQDVIEENIQIKEKIYRNT